MAKDKKDQATNGETAVAEKKEVATPAVQDGAIISNEEAAEKLRNAKVGKLDSGYMKFEPGDKKRVIYVGRKEIPGLDPKNPDKKTNAIVFKTDDGKEQINADVAVISYFEKQQLGCAREIHCKGMTKGPNGEYRSFEFRELEFETK